MVPSREALVRNEERLHRAMGTPDVWRARNPARRDIADQAVEGYVRFQHIGERFVDVGRANIDWSGPQIKHQEWPAQLNRFFQLWDLAAAWEETRDERYPRTARDLIADWVRAHPVRPDWAIARYDNTLNLSIRVQIWVGSLPCFLNSPAFDEAFVTALIESAACQLDFLCGHLTPAHNWRIAQADSLLMSGIRLTGLPAAERWRRLGARVINDAFHRQVLPDGAHDERNAHYHVWMTKVFERYWRIGRELPELGLRVQADGVARMHDYALASLRPNGAQNALHDGYGVHTGRRPADWRDARDCFRRDAGLPAGLPPLAQVFPHAGQACWRDSWEEDATYVTFDATPWGGGHTHLGCNGVQLHANGRSLLVDPGTLTYEVSDPMMAHGKSTRAHNTLNLNGWSQCEAHPQARFLSAPGYDLALNAYTEGYWPGEYTWGWRRGHGQGLCARHHRIALWIHGRCLVVLDRLTHAEPCVTSAPSPAQYESPPRAAAPHEKALFAESNWQFSEGAVELDAAARRACTRHPDSNLLALFPLAPANVALSLHTGEKDPPRGWLRAENGYQPGTQLCLRADRPAARTDWAAVFIPFTGATPDVTAEATPGAVNLLKLRWPGGESDTVLWTPEAETAIGEADGIETDAGLVHLQRDAAGRLVRGMALDATFLSPHAPAPRPAPQCFSFCGETMP